MPSLQSRPFAWSGKWRVDEAIRCRQLRAITSRRTSGPTPFQRRGCGLPSALLGPREAFTEPRRPSDVPVVTLRHARSALLADRCAFRLTALADDEAGIDLRAEGPCFASPVRAMRAKARERLPSYREPESRNPQAEPARTFYRLRRTAHRFAISLLVPRVRRCFELPSG